MTVNFSHIQTPEQVKELSIDELPELAQSLKKDIIQYTSLNGGHIGASLCCVDFILAMHRVFNSPTDHFIFDVGHQAYAHKMLTGRRKEFSKLRKENGLAGFTSRAESTHDIFGAGHASTSISAALGVAAGKRLAGVDGKVVAVLGDGALTGGLTFEGLNHAGELEEDLIIVLNDNEMSIDPNVGRLKDSFKEHRAGDYFRLLGVHYEGPFDGHDVIALVQKFSELKKRQGPQVLHLLTVKGHSYAPAEKDKIRFHGCGPFELESGSAVTAPNARAKYQDIFAQTMIKLTEADAQIQAITAAMPSGTSLNKFQKVHPNNFYDVGLAEPHAVLFGAGLATQGLKPFVCIYSTFLQRAYDQLIHDVGLQNLPVRFCLDRGGVVGDDGATHQGVFDYVYLCTIPNFVVMAPRDEAELVHMLETARVYNQGPITIRFPRGEITGAVPLPENPAALPIGKAEIIYGETTGDFLILAIGHSVNEALAAAQKLSLEGDKVTVVNLRFAKPLDEDLILSLAGGFSRIISVEEGQRMGGVGMRILDLLHTQGIAVPMTILGIPDEFIHHASQTRQRELAGIDAEAIVNSAKALHASATSKIRRVTAA